MMGSLLRWLYRTETPSRVRGAHRLSEFLRHRCTSEPVRVQGLPPVYVNVASGHWQAKDWFVNTPLKDWKYEPHVFPVFGRVVRKGDVAFDIGANIGFYSVLLHSLGAKVYAFEPNPALKPNLRRSFSGLNPQIKLMPVALSDEPGSVTLFIPEHGHDAASFGKWKPSVDQFESRVETLDSLDLPQPDFIKCDVEGAESKVFRGGRAMLSDCKRAPALIFEEHFGMARAQGLEKEAAQKFLCSLPSRYRFFLIDRETGTIEPSTGERPYWCDVLAVPECKMDRVREFTQARD